MSVEEILNTDPFSMAFRVTHPDDLVAEQKLFAELVAGTRRSYQVEKRYMRRDALSVLDFSLSAGSTEPLRSQGPGAAHCVSWWSRSSTSRIGKPWPRRCIAAMKSSGTRRRSTASGDSPRASLTTSTTC